MTEHGTMEAHGATFNEDGTKRESMVERVTQLIMEMIEVRRCSIKPEHNLNYLRAYEPIARAVIAAMREPTDAMVEASNREWDGRMSHRSSGAWQAMIDEALK
jgi:hypothetical protein